MTREAILYYATNRRHRGTDRWNPAGYSAEPSRDGVENLRFGRVIVPFEQERVAKELTRKIDFGTGDGERLARYLHSQRGAARIEAFEENLDKGVSDTKQKQTKFGSTRPISDLAKSMAVYFDTFA